MNKVRLNVKKNLSSTYYVRSILLDITAKDTDVMETSLITQNF